MNGPTYEQMERLGQISDSLVHRTVAVLIEMQTSSTRISGMALEVDKAMEEAVRRWAKELTPRVG